MADPVHVKGLDQLQKLLDTLPTKIARNILRGSLRAGMKVVLPAVKGNLDTAGSVETGKLRDGLKLRTRALGGTVIASIQSKGEHGYIARFLEYGTAAHIIWGRNGGWLSLHGGRFARSVNHPGILARPFLRPALDAQASAAVVAAAEYMKKRLATKEGLDTSDIDIEAVE